MDTPDATLPQQYFDAIYQANSDPWGFATSDYERGKYEATLAALPKQHYENVFEIGCSIGVLSAMLAPHCGKLLAVDASELPLQTARERLAVFPQVTVRQLSVPDQFPDGPFDLILLSEVGYYLSTSDLERTRSLMLDTLLPGGHLVLVHWTPVVHDYPLTGNQVHETFLSIAGPAQPLMHIQGQRADNYRLDVFQKN